MEKRPPQEQQRQQVLTDIDLDNLRATKVLGKGAMGTVFLAYDQTRDPASRTPFALKVVEKSSLNNKFEAERRARWEIQVLAKLAACNANPFLPHLLSSFENSDFLAWAVPFCPGGDLNVLRHRQTDRVFSPAVVRFYLAEIVCALEHLHDMGIVYRDLKPENILVQQSGHVTLTDFDLSRSLTKPRIETLLSSNHRRYEHQPVNAQRKHNRRNMSRWFPVVPNNDKKGLKKTNSARVSPVGRRKQSFVEGERSNSFVGTEEYVSPEVVRGDGHEFAVDWWALGILSYEMLYGTTPFKGKNRKETFRNVLMKQPGFVGKRNDLTDLIERLLEKDPTRRLGYQGGAGEIKEHVFFKGVQWELLTEVSRPPCIPLRDEFDTTGNVVTTGWLDIKEYFQNLRAPPSIPPSPSYECQKKMSFTEF